MLLLFPRLVGQKARDLAAGFRLAAIDEVASAGRAHFESLVDGDQVGGAGIEFGATGGLRIGATRLRALRSDLEAVAAELGYAETGGTPLDDGQAREVDVRWGERLRDHMSISRAEAMQAGVWAFLGCVLLPGLVRWRFPGDESRGTSDRRFTGSLVRNVFFRLWWRAELLGEPEDDDPSWRIRALSEDEQVALMERPNLVACTALVRPAVDQFLSIIELRPDLARMHVWRGVTKRLLRLLGILNFDLLDQVECSRAVAAAVLDTVKAMDAASGRRNGTVPVPKRSPLDELSPPAWMSRLFRELELHTLEDLAAMPLERAGSARGVGRLRLRQVERFRAKVVDLLAERHGSAPTPQATDADEPDVEGNAVPQESEVPGGQTQSKAIGPIAPGAMASLEDERSDAGAQVPGQHQRDDVRPSTSGLGDPGLEPLDEPVPVGRAMSNVLERLAVRTYRDALALDLTDLATARGVGRVKLRRLAELQAEARRRAPARDEPPTAVEPGSAPSQGRAWFAETPWAQWDPREALGRLRARACRVLDDFELDTVEKLAKWHATVNIRDVPNYGRGVHAHLGERLDALRREGAAGLVYGGPLPETVQELGERYVARLPADRRRIFRLRIGQGLTLEEVGQEMGLTRERVRQIVKTEIDKDRPAWAARARELVEPGIVSLDASGGLGLTTRLMAALGAPDTWTLELAMMLGGLDEELTVDVMPGVSTTMDRADFQALRSELKADIEARLSSSFSAAEVVAALQNEDVNLPADEVGPLAVTLFSVVIEGDRAWPSRRASTAAYVGALRDAGAPRTAAEIAEVVSEREPELEATARNAVVAFRRVPQVLSMEHGQWVHEANLPFSADILDSLAAESLPLVEAAAGEAISATHLLDGLRARRPVPNGVTPLLLRDALLKTGRVRGWRAGSQVAWNAGEVHRTSLRDRIVAMAADLEQPFSLQELIASVADEAGAQEASAYNVAMQLGDELIPVGNGDWLARRTVFEAHGSWVAALDGVESWLKGAEVHTALVEPVGLPDSLRSLVDRYSPRILWGLAHASSRCRVRRRGLLMWHADRGRTAWDAFGAGFLARHPVCRAADLHTSLFDGSALLNRDTVRHLMHDGEEEGFLARIGQGWFLDLRLPFDEQVAAIRANSAVLRLAHGNDDFVSASPASDVLRLARERPTGSDGGLRSHSFTVDPPIVVPLPAGGVTPPRGSVRPEVPRLAARTESSALQALVLDEMSTYDLPDEDAVLRVLSSAQRRRIRRVFDSYGAFCRALADRKMESG